jgi:hypothetical protein
MPPKEIQFMGVHYEPPTREFLSSLMMRFRYEEEKGKRKKELKEERGV